MAHPSWHELTTEALHVVQGLPVFPTARVYRGWHLRWGANSAERAVAMPGDALVPAAHYRSTRAITVEAPRSQVWPWLVQAGWLQTGFQHGRNAAGHTHPRAARLAEPPSSPGKHKDHARIRVPSGG